MKIDTSEVKTYRECHRKHLYSSRNRFHLRPVAPNANLVFGTQFHEVLAMIYLKTPKEKIMEWINHEVDDPDAYRMMLAMFEGYYNGPYQADKDRFEVIDIEKSFCIPVGAKYATGGVVPNENIKEFIPTPEAPEGSTFSKKDGWVAILTTGEVAEAICICGSIDMICLDKETGEVVGFEHKTAKNFRPEVYDVLDEQPRVYTWALKHIVKEKSYVEKGYTKVGPIYLNQVKKLKSKFDYQRVTCKYTENDLQMFMTAFLQTCDDVATHTCCQDSLPQPGYMKCQMCDYADLCMHYGYADIDEGQLLDEFEGEFEVRECDHLEEKASRHVE